PGPAAEVRGGDPRPAAGAPGRGDPVAGLARVPARGHADPPVHGPVRGLTRPQARFVIGSLINLHFSGSMLRAGADCVQPLISGDKTIPCVPPKELTMKKKLLCCALFGAMGIAQSAIGQEHDDRWYLHGAIGHTLLDEDRALKNDWHTIFGAGRMFGPDLSLDFDLSYINPYGGGNNQRNWSLYGAGVSARWYGREPGDTWRPYLKGGLGALRHEAEVPNPGLP